MSPARAGTTAVVAVLGAAALLLVLVTWAASIGPDRVLSGGSPDRIGEPEPTAASATADPTERPNDDRDRQGGETPAWVGVVALVLEVLTLAVALFLVGRLGLMLRQSWRRRTRRRRRAAPVVEVDFDVLGEAVRVGEAIEEDASEQRALLAEDGEPRNAIVAVWHRFELQAMRAGIVRQPWQTTAEFVLGVLDLVGADQGAVGRLADLYREARFSDHPITDEHRRAALEALDAVHHSLRVGVRT